jgi:hypothetical protein
MNAVVGRLRRFVRVTRRVWRVNVLMRQWVTTHYLYSSGIHYWGLNRFVRWNNRRDSIGGCDGCREPDWGSERPVYGVVRSG